MSYCVMTFDVLCVWAACVSLLNVFVWCVFDLLCDVVWSVLFLCVLCVFVSCAASFCG